MCFEVVPPTERKVCVYIVDCREEETPESQDTHTLISIEKHWNLNQRDESQTSMRKDQDDKTNNRTSGVAGSGVGFPPSSGLILLSSREDRSDSVAAALNR